MSVWEIIILGIGLSMDALAVSLCKGLTMRRFRLRDGLVIAGFFGGFQALMPLIGWLLGISLARYIQAVDHWIAFGLLLFLGGKMILDAIREMKNPDPPEQEYTFRLTQLLLMAIATSIDALAAGLTFAFLQTGTESSASGASLSIWISILLIGAITFCICLAGVWIGYRFGSWFETKAQIAGGIILILLGVKILIEHLTQQSIL